MAADTLIDSGPAEWLMDRDARNLELTEADGRVRVEVYTFVSPSVTAGRNVKISAAEILRWSRLGHDFARRPTGGGILRHEGDLCFGICLSDARLAPRETLGVVSRSVRAALVEQGIEVEASLDCHAKKVPAKCFTRPIGCELCYRGEKVLGLASRKKRNAALVQGSLILSVHPERDMLILSGGPKVSLADTGFDEAEFARFLRQRS